MFLTVSSESVSARVKATCLFTKLRWNLSICQYTRELQLSLPTYMSGIYLKGEQGWVSKTLPQGPRPRGAARGPWALKALKAKTLSVTHVWLLSILPMKRDNWDGRYKKYNKHKKVHPVWNTCRNFWTNDLILMLFAIYNLHKICKVLYFMTQSNISNICWDIPPDFTIRAASAFMRPANMCAILFM